MNFCVIWSCASFIFHSMQGLNKKTDRYRQLSQSLSNRTNALLFCCRPLCVQLNSSQEKKQQGREKERRERERKKGELYSAPQKTFSWMSTSRETHPKLLDLHFLTLHTEDNLDSHSIMSSPKSLNSHFLFLNRKPLGQRILFNSIHLAGPGNQPSVVTQFHNRRSTLTAHMPSILAQDFGDGRNLTAGGCEWMMETTSKGVRDRDTALGSVWRCSPLVNKTKSAGFHLRAQALWVRSTRHLNSTSWKSPESCAGSHSLHGFGDMTPLKTCVG